MTFLRISRRLCVALAGAVLIAGCGQSTNGITPENPTALQRGPSQGKVSHVVIIVQENRTVDNLFYGLPGADTVRYGVNSDGRRVRLEPEHLASPYDISHEHSAFAVEFRKGKLNGFDLVHSHCGARDRHKCPLRGRRAYGWVPHSEIRPYLDMAKQYAFADRMFETNEGPSFPAHQYLISGTSTVSQGSDLRAAENPLTRGQRFTGGCDAPPGALVRLIDSAGQENQEIYPCLDRPTLADLLDAQSLSWRYYIGRVQPGLWNAFDAISHIRKRTEYYTNVVSPPSRVLTDITNGNLASVVWVTPTSKASDHSGQTDGSGPSWVASVVNAVGQSKYWDSTTIVVVWDDWGGWYDHVAPHRYNSYELGFRVPMIVISPYAKKGYISHTQHEFGSILKFVEETFGLGSLGTTDQRADDLADCFDFHRGPRAFQVIPSVLAPSYFLNQPPDTQDPDDDF